MFTQFRNSIHAWRSHRQLLALSLLPSFDGVAVERVIRTLQGYSRSSLNTASVNRDNAQRWFECQRALMRIWHLSRAQRVRQDGSRFKWHQVMASCNSMYNPGMSAANRISRLAAVS